uniref:Major facilitator superfamily (MFS) profile domain-containing protein n=1 Tax=Lutzomyia longipalpis TaxID=7200 RepID=A0A1B0CD30_LUTLO
RFFLSLNFSKGVQYEKEGISFITHKRTKRGFVLLFVVGATLIASLASLTIYFSISPIMVVVMYSLGVGLSSAAHAAFGSILPSIGPTAFRSTVISISLTCGRIGSMLGTYLFPYLMAQTCWLPFVAVAVDLLFSSVLCIFLPRTTKKRLL